jgi:tetratricopeptide (TPR) repeat protein
MSDNWMKAAGEDGIPSAFLINGEGRIAWIGHPMDGLDKAIDMVLTNGGDMEKARAARTAAKAKEDEQTKARNEMRAKLQPTLKALQAKNYQEASDEADKLIKNDAQLKPTVSQYKLMAMVQGNLKGLDTYLTSLGKEEYAKDPMTLNQIIWTVVELDLKLPHEAYKSAVGLGEKMMALAPSDAMNMDTYALALWRSGDKKKALATQKKAVSLASANKEIPAETVAEMKARLKEFGG